LCLFFLEGPSPPSPFMVTRLFSFRCPHASQNLRSWTSSLLPPPPRLSGGTQLGTAPLLSHPSRSLSLTTFRKGPRSQGTTLTDHRRPTWKSSLVGGPPSWWPETRLRVSPPCPEFYPVGTPFSVPNTHQVIRIFFFSVSRDCAAPNANKRLLVPWADQTP